MIIDDPEILAGNANATIYLNFTQLEEKDQTTKSRYVMAGRSYFEANLYGNNLSSYVTKGFFDKQDYVEPSHNKLPEDDVVAIVLTTIFFFLVIVCTLYCCCKKKTKANEHLD